MTANRNSITCPECDARVRTITSRLLSKHVREIYFDCTNVDCLHRFVAHLGFVRTVVPSLTPRMDVTQSIVERRPNDIIVTTAMPSVEPSKSIHPASLKQAQIPFSWPAPTAPH